MPFLKPTQIIILHMKKLFLSLAIIAAAAFQLSAADAKTYQVTGPVLEVTPTYLVVQKGDEKWQLAADKATLGAVKVGEKVTVQYQMVAKQIEIKPGSVEHLEKKTEKAEKKAEKK